MSVRFAVLFVVFLAYVLSSGVVTKQGSGFDPMGLNAPPAPPAPTSDQGSGFDPMG